MIYNKLSKSLACFFVATSEQWKDKQTGEYIRKGSQVYIEGQLCNRKWTDSNGVKRYTTEIVIPQMGGVMQMLGGKRDDSGQQPQQQQPPKQQIPQGGNEPPMDFDDDIPF